MIEAKLSPYERQQIVEALSHPSKKERRISSIELSIVESNARHERLMVRQAEEEAERRIQERERTK